MLKSIMSTLDERTDGGSRSGIEHRSRGAHDSRVPERTAIR